MRGPKQSIQLLCLVLVPHLSLSYTAALSPFPCPHSQRNSSEKEKRRILLLFLAHNYRQVPSVLLGQLYFSNADLKSFRVAWKLNFTAARKKKQKTNPWSTSCQIPMTAAALSYPSRRPQIHRHLTSIFYWHTF